MDGSNQLVTWQAVADGLLALALVAIPAGLGFLMWRRRDLAHARIYQAFSLFLLLGGLAHAMDVWVLFRADQGLRLAVTLLAGLAAGAAAIGLWRAMPRLLAMPSNPELAAQVRRQTAALEQSEQRFRDFAALQSDWLWETDAAMRLTWVSERSTGDGHNGGNGGKPPAEFVEQRRAEDVVDADGPAWRAHQADLAARRPFRNMVYGRRLRDGRVVYSRASGKPMFDANGVFLGYRGASSDATGEVEAEQRATRAHALLVDAIESLPAALVVFDRDERLVLSNSVARDMLSPDGTVIAPGRTAEQMIRLAADKAVFGRIEEKETWIAERLARFRRGDATAEDVMADGRWFQVFDRRTSEGGLVSIRLDITAMKQAEEQLRESQKLQAIGQLTGGVAHDFNNLLAVIVGNLDLIGQEARDQPVVIEMADAAMLAAERGAALVQRLLAFARRQPLRPRTIDLNALVDGMDALLHRTLGEAVEVRAVLAEGLWPTHADPGQVENALLNLAINARDAMPDGGRLTVETANRRLDADYAAREPEVAAGDYAMLAVTDTGTGMAPEVAARAIEPFFTTKPVGQGTGLGLSMIYGFAKQSGGHVKIYSEPGHGTTVRLYLPRAGQAADAAETPAAPPTPRGRETVLAVEDDPAVQATVASLLVDLGYRVLLADDARTALAMLDANPDIALLFTDIVMPGGMNGIALAAAARRRRPELKVLFCSGYAEMAIARDGRIDADRELIGKPYRKQQLAAKLREVLDG